MERALIRESNSLFRIYCREHNIPIQPVGSIVCSWPWDEHDSDGDSDNDYDHLNIHIEEGEDRDKNYGEKKEDMFHVQARKTKQREERLKGGGNGLTRVFNESLDANDTHVCRLSSAQIQSLEPNLSSEVLGGVRIPGEIVVDPWLYSVSLVVHARENGAHIYTNSRFDAEESTFDSENEVWNIVVCDTITKTKNSAAASSDGTNSSNPKRLRAKAVINAAGLWSDVIQKQALQKRGKDNSFTSVRTTAISTEKKSYSGIKTWEARPRRGQYRIYKSNSTTSITHPVQPIPTQRTKGIFVFSSYYNQIICGPTALDQESKTDRSIDQEVAQELNNHIGRIIPNIDTDKDCIGEYVGIRPGTDKRDYQIHLSPKKNWIAVAGIRSTGLTASLGIGNYVSRLLHIILDDCTSRDGLPLISTTPLPPLHSLIRDFQRRDDGFVKIHNFKYKVTHPLTLAGWREQRF